MSLPGAAVRLERASDEIWASRTNLQPQRTTFIDRPEVAELVALLEGPLVTIRGPAGIGKTRLAYEVGLRQLREHPDIEVWFCDLSCALGESGITRALETTFGITEPTPDSKLRIQRVLARKPAGSVIILDNIDQVTHHATPIEEWLGKAPGVRFVTTSRHALGLPHERCLDVGPLDVDAAADLFADRSFSSRALDPRSAPLRTLVQRLDCLPLAIELAAARATDFTAEELLARLNDRLNWLVRPPAHAVSSHRSLRGALDWSWDLLNEDARTAMAECAVFARGFSTELARGVLSVPAVASTLAHLADRSLLQREGDGWRMYEGIREYAREKAILLGIWEQTCERHAELCVRRASDAAGRLNGRSLVAALSELRSLRDELFAIHTRATQPAIKVRAALALCPLLETDGPRELVSTVCGEALKHGPPPEIAWRLWVGIGYVARLASRFDHATDALRNALHAGAQVGEHPRAIAACELAFALCDSGRVAEAEPMLHESLTVFRAVGDRARETDTLRYLAKLHRGRSTDEALRQLERVRDLVEQTGDPLRAFHTHRELIQLHLRRSDLDAATGAISDAIRCARELKLRRGEYDALRWLAVISRQRGDLAGAIRLLEEGLRGYEALGEEEGRAQLLLRLLALVLLEAGDLERAEQALIQACAEPEDDAENRMADLGNLAIVWHLQGRMDAAINAMQRLVERIGSGRLRAPVLGHLAVAYADDDRVELAEQTLALARETAPASTEPFLGLCGAVIALARARADDREAHDAVGRARSEIRAVTRPGPTGSPSLAQRDQDVNILRIVLERALERTVAQAAKTA
ncbi:MAG: tetratricopeptide repeat protein [Myxococcota bacterium]